MGGAAGGSPDSPGKSLDKLEDFTGGLQQIPRKNERGFGGTILREKLLKALEKEGSFASEPAVWVQRDSNP